MFRFVQIPFLIGFIVTTVSCFPEPVLATPTNDNPKFEFIIDFAEPDWSHRSINATISSKISSFPSSFLTIPCTLMNLFYFKGEPTHGGWVRYDMVPSETETVNETTLVTFVNQTTAEFRLLGLAEFYPYDSYLLNLTFSFPDNGFANNNNTSVEMNFPLWGLYGWRIDTEIIRITHEGDFVKIRSATRMTRSSYVIEPLRFILWIMFGVLGTSFLISPKNLSIRLTLYIAVLLFSISFFFQSSAMAPPRYGSLSLLENLILDLLLAASVFLMFSVAEKVAIYDYKTVPEIRGALSIETAGVIITAFYIFRHFDAYVNLAESHFSWVTIPHLGYELTLLLSFGLLMKYIHHVSQYIRERRHIARIKTLNDFT